MGSAPEQELDDLIVGVHYVGITVPDVEDSGRFYEAAFDVRRMGESELSLAGMPADLRPEGAEQARSLLLRSPNAQVRLMSFEGQDYSAPRDISAVPVQGPGIIHVCFQAIEEMGAYARAIAAGASTIGDPEPVALSSRNPVKYGYITDANGIVTEVEEVDVSQLDLPEPPKNPIRMRHVAFATPDLDRMVSFWSAFLGDQEPRRIGSWFSISGENVDAVSGIPGSEIEMAWFQLRNLEIEIAQYHSHPTKLPETPRPLDAPGYNMVVFDVTDLNAAQDRLLEAGGTLIEGTGSLDGATIIFGRDPDGNLIGLQSLPKSSIYSAKNFADQGI
ncbi:VOC family protein [Erythrobacter sp. THAF29]|uniref:VOC family protein n=1 Tax=Erythrobacter sp. THAF29 TaxID=2587851 RepID=UPI001561F70B|nr:VOC family protein [Erythrobacter sp. THAF29]